MEIFKIVIDGQEYETEASTEDEAREKINDYLRNQVKTTNKDNKIQEKVDMSSMKKKRTVIDYKILKSKSHSSLANSVVALMKDKGKGQWEPTGGVGVTQYVGEGLLGGIDRYEFFQAMVCYYEKK